MSGGFQRSGVIPVGWRDFGASGTHGWKDAVDNKMGSELLCAPALVGRIGLQKTLDASYGVCVLKRPALNGVRRCLLLAAAMSFEQREEP